MAVERVSELFKTAMKLSLILYLLLLAVCNAMATVYLVVILVPLVYVAVYKLSLPPAEEWIADEMLGPPATNDCTLSRRSLVIAHRTCALEAPENTIAGIRKAKADGAVGVEVDVRFTKDDVAVLLHDDCVNRTTNGVGCIAMLTYAEVSHLDASFNHLYHNKYKGECIPKLEDAIKECICLELKMFIEMKDVDERAIKVLLDIYQRYPVLYEVAVIVSFYPYFLYQLRRNDPSILTVLVWRPYVMSRDTSSGLLEDSLPRYDNKPQQALAAFLDVVLEWAVHNVLWHICGVSGMLIHKAVICPRYVSHWARLNMRVLVWTVNSVREKDYLTNVLRLSYMTDTVKVPEAATCPARAISTCCRRKSPIQPSVPSCSDKEEESVC